MLALSLSHGRAVVVQHRTFPMTVQRLKSTNSNARAYLDAWVGLSPAPASSAATIRSNNPILKARTAMAQGPLFVTGTSYLLPTLRLERNTDPQSLAQRLQQSSSSDSSCGTDKGEKFPIVLDMSSFKPDGSHHYQAPPPGILKEFLTVLHLHNFKVMGICGLLPLSLEQEATKEGIPSLWAPTRATADPKFDISQLFQLVQQREQQQQAGVPSSETDQQSLAEHDYKRQDEMATVDGKKMDGKSEGNDNGNYLHIPKSNTTNDADGNNPSQADAAIQIPAPIESSSGSTLYYGSVRSGQQIMSEKGQSLVIMGSVSSGGEVLSDGDIFIFGKLRGRALAGLGASESQDENVSSTCSARIIATSFDPELVGIGDLFTTVDRVEDMNPKVALKTGQPIMVTMSMSKVKDVKTRRSLEFLPLNM